MMMIDTKIAHLRALRLQREAAIREAREQARMQRFGRFLEHASAVLAGPMSPAATMQLIRDARKVI